ncbi:MAG: tetratricopeptide repeat protein [Pirellulales bacterium]|nr:tetratricopeptide repeat protein [Pirellulales bacterium]
MKKHRKFPDRPAVHSPGGTPAPATPRHLAWAGAALIAVAVFFAYFPSIEGGFIWDDHLLITDCKLIAASDGLYRFWCTTDPYDYWPVTNSSFWIEWRLWGMNPTGYRVVNLLLHVSESLLIWYLLRKLAVPGAFPAALLFAVHPVNVETVAWIAQRKNLLAMLFVLLSMLWYWKAEMSGGERAARAANKKNPNDAEPLGGSALIAQNSIPTSYPPEVVKKLGQAPHNTHYSTDNRQLGSEPVPFFYNLASPWYWLSLLAFALAMLSKGSAAVLPALLLGMIGWRRKLSWRDLARTAPFFAVSAVLVGVNIWFQRHGAETVIRNAGFIERLLGAGGAVWFYLSKAILPIDLCFVYPQWRIQTGNWLWWLPLLAALAVTVALWRYRGKWSRPVLFAWGFFCIALVPVMGFTDVYFMKYSLVADHYQHLALLGPIVLAAAGWSAWRGRSRGAAPAFAMLAAILAAGTLATLTWRQSRQYRDEIALYRATLEKNPDCWMACNNLGKALLEAGRPEEAIGCFRSSLRLNPQNHEAHNNLGTVLCDRGEISEAIEHFREALRLKPDFLDAQYDLGLALAKAGRPDEAIFYYREALKTDPEYAKAYNGLGNALIEIGLWPEGIESFERAIELQPGFAEAHGNLGFALARIGRLKEAIDHYEQALRLQPDLPQAHNNLGNALVRMDRPQEAIEHFRQALRLQPNSPQIHFNLANTLVEAGAPREAVRLYERAIDLQPDYAEARFNLAIAYHQIGRRADALRAAQKALDLARTQGKTALARQIEDWLLY